MRRNQFVVSAESVQGNAGAEVTFRKVTVGERDRYLEDPEYGDLSIVRDHLLDWVGIVDDEGHELPSPKDEPGVDAALYLDEVGTLARLLFQGPDGISAKN